MVLAAAVAVFGLTPSPPAAAAELPAGGSCASPAVITGNGTARGSTAGAPSEHTGESYFLDGTGAPDRVWTFTVDQPSTLHVRSSGVDAFLHFIFAAYHETHADNVYDFSCGDRGADAVFAKADNWVQSQQSGDWSIEMETTLDPGQHYFWIDGDNSGHTADSGSYELTFTFDGGQPTGASSPPPPSSGASPQPGTDRRLANSTDAALAAIDLSRGTFHDGAADVVILGRDDVFADSLAGAGLSGSFTGPILYTTGGLGRPLRSETHAEIRRVLGTPGDCASGGPGVFILGGVNAVSQAAEDAIRGEGYCARRFAGASRVETSVLIAEFLAASHGFDEVLLATSENWADAATGGAYAAAAGAPILVTQPGALHPAVASFLSSAGDPLITLLGGGAALSSQVESAAAAYGAVDRVAGSARDATAVAIADVLWAGLDPTGIILVNGYTDLGWAYALAAAVPAALERAVVLYTQAGSLTPATRSYVGSTSYDFVIAGGPASLISDDVYAEVSGGGSAAPEPTPEPEPACRQSSRVYQDPIGDDGGDGGADITAVDATAFENGGACVAEFTIHLSNDFASAYTDSAGVFLDTDANESTGCNGGDLAVVLYDVHTSSAGAYGVLFDVASCESATENTTLAYGASLNDDSSMTFFVDAEVLPDNARFRASAIEAPSSGVGQDWAPGLGLGTLTPVFA